MKKILITGITGFAGSFLAEKLVQSSENEVHGTYIAEKSLENIKPIKAKLNLHYINLLDQSAVRDLIFQIKPDEVYHLAALTSPSQSFKNPAETISNNANAQIYLLESIVAAGITPRILIVSSADIYGKVKESDMPMDEETPLNPVNPYAVSKIAQDFLGLSYYYSSKLPIIRVRPFNHIGPRQAPMFVVPDFAKQVAEIEKGKKEPVMKVGNIEVKRDFTDVRDMVEAYILAIEKGKPGDVYNLGSGKSFWIKDVLKTLLDLSNVSIKVEKDPDLFRPSEIIDRYSSIAKFQKITNWQPQIPFEKTLKDTLEYWRDIV